MMWSSRPGNFVTLISVILASPTATSSIGVRAAPQAGSDGLCYKYVVQAGETCTTIAQAHSLALADIETYNAQTWEWLGCEHLLQGAVICLSAGEPAMPATLSNAVCGPRVPGTKRPSSWSDLGSLNPCIANECCSPYGYCGSTSDFCISAHSTNRTEGTTLTKTATPTRAAKATQKFMAVQNFFFSPFSKTTSTSAAKSSTTTTKTTSTSKATSAMSTKSSKTPAGTKSDSAYVHPWTVEMYTKKNCKGNYIQLKGHNVGWKKDLKCLRPDGSLPTESTDGYSCKWFYDNGASSTGCSAGGVDAPASWIVKGGYCNIWEYVSCNQTKHRHMSYYNPECRNRNEFDIGNWWSFNCWVPPGFHGA